MITYGRITLLITGIFFIFGLTKSKIGLYLLIFLIPFEGAALRSIGITGFCVIGYFMGYWYAKSRLNENILKNIHYQKYILLITISIIISLFAVAIKQDYSDLILNSSDDTIVRSLMRYMINIAASIMLYILISNEIKTYKGILNCVWAFILSLSYIFITWIGSFIYIIDLPKFLQTKYSGLSSYNDIMRFAGYTREYGLQSEYFMFIIAFSILLIFSPQKKNTRKLISIIGIVLSIPMVISTGTRAFILVLFLFVIIFISLIIFKKKVSYGKKFLIIGSLSIFMILFSTILRGSFLLERVTKTIDIGRSVRYINDIDNLLNRPYIAEFNNTVETVGLFGVGPLNISGIRGETNTMCWHSLYFDMYIKFGILGLLVYIFFYFKLLSDLFKDIRLKGVLQSIPSIILFSLFLPLLIGEYARSYQNQTSFMLIYWFLFAIIACVNKMKPDFVLKDKNYTGRNIKKLWKIK